MELEEPGLAIWAFLRTWEGEFFRLVAIGVLDRFEIDATCKLFVVETVVAAVGCCASTVAISGGLTILLRHWWIIWVVDTRRDSLSTQSLTCGC